MGDQYDKYRQEVSRKYAPNAVRQELNAEGYRNSLERVEGYFFSRLMMFELKELPNEFRANFLQKKEPENFSKHSKGVPPKFSLSLDDSNYYGHMTPKHQIEAEVLIGPNAKELACMPLNFTPFTDFQTFQTHICYSFDQKIFVASLKEELDWTELRMTRLSLQLPDSSDDAIEEIVELDFFSKKRAPVLGLAPVRYRNGECESVVGFSRSEVFLLNFEN